MNLSRKSKRELIEMLQEREILAPIETSVRHALAGVATSDGFDDARAALAIKLAKQLDDGMGLATAGVSKELRAVLSEIDTGNDDEDEDGFGDGLPTPLGNA